MPTSHRGPLDQSHDSSRTSESLDNVEVWKDSSADEKYDDYLDHHSVRPTFAAHATNSGNRPTFADGNANTHPDITVGLLEDEKTVRKKTFTGRKRKWPGALMLLLVCAGAVLGIVWFGSKLYSKTQIQQTKSEKILNRKPKPITPLKICEQPNFMSDESGGIIASYKNGDKKRIRITGINWSGMENPEGVPHGLALDQSNMDEIAKKLNKQDITAVRLPLNVKMILDNTAPNIKSFVNTFDSPELNVNSYIDMIKKVVQGLAKQQIAVLLDLHKLDPELPGNIPGQGLWYNNSIGLTEAKVQLALTTLGVELCSPTYYNIIGVDLKNEPFEACWPNGANDPDCPTSRNWPAAAGRLGDALLKSCPKWLVVVEGTLEHRITGMFNSQNLTYDDWFGASLNNASLYPVQISKQYANKVVYAPHFYSPSVYPAAYYYMKQDASKGIFEEYPNTPEGNKLLKAAVYQALDRSFGTAVAKTKIPVMYGEFGGIYGTADTSPQKTSSRVIEMFITYAADRNMSGGFAWSLNPDSVYDFNTALKTGAFQYGLYKMDWLNYNEDYATTLRKFQGSGPIYCVPVDSLSTVTDGSSDKTTPTSGSKPGTIKP